MIDTKYQSIQKHSEDSSLCFLVCGLVVLYSYGFLYCGDGCSFLFDLFLIERRLSVWFSCCVVGIDIRFPIGREMRLSPSDFADRFAENSVIQRSSFFIAMIIGGMILVDAESSGGFDGVDIRSEEKKFPVVF